MLIYVAVVLFWCCVGAMVHTYFLYPLTLRLLPRRRIKAESFADGEWPTVAVLVPAYNEERVIASKVENSLAIDYEPGKLEVIVGSDGSTDRTNEIVRSIGDSRLKLLELEGRNGKPIVLNRLAESTQADILVFTDANVSIDKEALKKIVRHYADPDVGCVCCGKHVIVPEGSTAVEAEAVYAESVTKLRALESRAGGMSGGLGSCLSVRRELYQPLHADSLCDDMVPPITTVLAGRRSVFEPEAHVYEDAGATVGIEFRRRVRSGAANYQILFRYARVLKPRCGVPAYTYFSHKVLRWIFPWLMIGAFAANMILLGRGFYNLVMAGQIVFYGGAMIGGLGHVLRMRMPMLSTLFHFVVMNLALLCGFFVYLRGIKTAVWEPTARGGD